VVSHADDDHIGGLIAVIMHKKNKIKKIIHSGLALLYLILLDLVEKQ
jgi:beta-lactamase superfamily II metal-dependent hydrolase